MKIEDMIKTRKFWRRTVEFDPLSIAAELYHSHIKPYVFQIIVSVVLILITYGFSAFNLLLVGNDWVALYDKEFGLLWSIRIGRWFQVVVWKIFANNAFAPPFTLFGSIGLLALSAWITTRVLRLRNIWSVFLFVHLFILFPIWAEPMGFKMVHLTLAFGVLFGVIHGALAVKAAQSALSKGTFKGTRTTLLICTSALFFALSASCYQPSTLFGPMVFVASFMGTLLQTDREADYGRVFIAYFLVSIAILPLGGILYYSGVQASFKISSLQELERGRYILFHSLRSSFTEYQEGFSNAWRYFKHFLFRPQHLFPMIPKYMFLAALTILGALVLERAFKLKTLKKKIVFLFLISLALALEFLIPWAIGIIRSPPMYRYNALIGLAFLYPLVFTFTIEHLKIPLIRFGLVFLAFLTLGMFAFQHNIAALSMYTTNQRDLAIAGRILQRIEEHKDYLNLAQDGRYTLVIIGRLDLKKIRPFAPPMYPGIMNESIVQCGVFNCQPDKVKWLFKQIESKHVKRKIILGNGLCKRKKFKERLIKRLQSIKPWPHPTSLFTIQDEDMFVLFLSA